MSDVNKVTLERMATAQQEAGAEIELEAMRRERAELIRIGHDLLRWNRELADKVVALERRLARLLED